MKVGTLFFFLIFSFYFSCSDSTLPSLFELRPLNPKDLISLGYERVYGVDVLLYERQNQDTVFVYEFEGTEKEYELYSQSWVFEININTLEELKTALDYLEVKYYDELTLEGKINLKKDGLNLSSYVSVVESDLIISYLY